MLVITLLVNIKIKHHKYIIYKLIVMIYIGS